jgi:hypothetical protein
VGGGGELGEYAKRNYASSPSIYSTFFFRARQVISKKMFPKAVFTLFQLIFLIFSFLVLRILSKWLYLFFLFISRIQDKLAIRRPSFFSQALLIVSIAKES